jgi:hypothetical protein
MFAVQIGPMPRLLTHFRVVFRRSSVCAIVLLPKDLKWHGKRRATPPREKVLDGKSEAKVIALRLGKPPKGYANWSLRLLADHVVELGLVESISHETVRQTLKKTG